MDENLKYNSEKFKTMIHYIISRCENKDNFDNVVLYTLLYFSDFNYYELYEEPITGETYSKKAMGPVPIHFLEAINELIDEGKISVNRKR
ncbi:type II toxin-antitoxin system antitoxin SocA domain-containing protein [Methanobrevibacter wolinii]|uniref:type II toxin-antitoxin system antitoxin SocA domain-containing protein n=1 Tax=Methanobrevibacter wolinii TaxID=190977 RepID=UPI0005B2CBB7|nr:type II toxin-antitoxin system antitoxin SocA domain-containing protein [Methanobrevibacter wolinii]